MPNRATPPGATPRPTPHDETPQSSPDVEIAVSVYDLDGTLTRDGTYLRFLLHAARRLRPWRLLRLPEVVVAMAAYGAGAFTRKRLKEIMHERLLGRSLPEAQVRAVAESFAEHVTARGCRPRVVARLRSDQACGRAVVIATAAQRVYVEALARRLGVAHVVATESVWRDGELQARIAGPNRRGTEKLAALKAHLDGHADLAGRAFVFYSDEISDMPVFELAARCVAVHPGGRLRRLAEARGWEILD